jgi:histidinol phosphatase-like enzyme
MILGLAAKWRINLGESILIGDRQTDIEAGIRSGCQSYLFDCGDLDILARRVLEIAHRP